MIVYTKAWPSILNPGSPMKVDLYRVWVPHPCGLAWRQEHGTARASQSSSGESCGTCAKYRRVPPEETTCDSRLSLMQAISIMHL